MPSSVWAPALSRNPQRVAVSWQELEEPRAVVNPRGGCGPADGPDPAHAGSEAESAWFGNGGKGPSPCPIPGRQGERGIPDLSPRICSKEAWTTQSCTFYPGACAEGVIKPAQEAECRELLQALGSQHIPTFCLPCSSAEPNL